MTLHDMTQQDNGTAPPSPGSPHQSQRHSASQTRLSPPITTAQRHPDQALPSNHNGTTPQRPRFPHQSQRHSAGTAPHRPGSPQQSQWHSATKMRPGDPPRGQSGTNERERSCANVRERARTQSRNRNEHGPAPRPPRQKQEPFATHSGKKRCAPNNIKWGARSSCLGRPKPCCAHSNT